MRSQHVELVHCIKICFIRIETIDSALTHRLPRRISEKDLRSADSWRIAGSWKTANEGKGTLPL